MPATVSHALSMTTPDEKEANRLLQNARNMASYYKYHEIRKKTNREYQRVRHAENPEHVKNLSKAWNEANRDRVNSAHRIRREKTPDKRYPRNIEREVCYYQANKEKWREAYRKWSKNNPEKEAARAANRRAAKRGAVPAWADHEAIKMIYAQAAKISAKTGIQHDVDHIIPLRGKLVCGLHCENNLQILTMAENAAKGNKCL